MATPFRARLNTLMTALRWTLSGNPESAATLKAQMGSVAEAGGELPLAPSGWLFNSNGWEGDARWLWLVSQEGSDVRNTFTAARLAWHMAYLWAEEKGARGLALFWSAALEAASRPEKEDGANEDGQPRRAQALREAQSTMARALLETFPQEAKKAMPWEEAKVAWPASGNASSWNMAFQAYLSVLARPEHLATELQDISKDVLQSLSPKEWPWALWLVLNNEGDTLLRDLATEGGASQWPGIQGWEVPQAWLDRIEGRADQCAQALRDINATLPTHAKNKFRSQPPLAKETLARIAANAVHLAEDWNLPDSLKALLARGVNPNSIDGAQRLPLDYAVLRNGLGTARNLVEAGALFSTELPEHPDFANANPWTLLYTTKKSVGAVGFREPWQSLEKAMWARGESTIKSKWTPHQHLKMAYEIADHPHAAYSLLRLFDPAMGVNPNMLITGWLATQEKATNTRLVRSLLTLAVHNPDWSQADKEALIERAFTGAAICANEMIDDFGGVPQLQTKDWEGVSARPVNALTYAIVHAPKLVPALLARSSSSEIEEALAAAPQSIGWKEGTTAKSSKAMGITHSWKKFMPIWAQALHSIDPPAAFAALAGHPLTRADRDVEYPIAIRDESVPLTGLEYAMVLTNDSHSATQMLQAGGPAASLNPVALLGWCKTPRDMEALRTGLALSGCVDAPADALGSTLLMRAIENKDRALVDLLIDLGAKLDGERSDGVSLQSVTNTAGPEWLETLLKARKARMGAVLGDVDEGVVVAARPRF